MRVARFATAALRHRELRAVAYASLSEVAEALIIFIDLDFSFRLPRAIAKHTKSNRRCND
jgi:hypothetical protein